MSPFRSIQHNFKLEIELAQDMVYEDLQRSQNQPMTGSMVILQIKSQSSGVLFLISVLIDDKYVFWGGIQDIKLKVCSHLTFASAFASTSKFNIASMETQTQMHRMGLNPFLTFAFASAFASTSPSKFNIASMETQTQMHRMGLNPFLTIYIDVDANANVRCEHTFIHQLSNYSYWFVTFI